jgi:hypothetical protein
MTGGDLKQLRLASEVAQRDLAVELGYRNGAGLCHLEKRPEVSDETIALYIKGLTRCIRMKRRTP